MAQVKILAVEMRMRVGPILLMLRCLGEIFANAIPDGKIIGVAEIYPDLS
jgi:hypothetical protein